MHIHGSHMNLNPSFYSAASAEKAEAARRAADTRKKLLKSAQEIETGEGSEESLMVHRWLAADQNHGQHQEEEEYSTVSYYG